MGPDTTVRAQAGADDWYKIVELGVMRRSSKYGFACEAKREPEIGDFEMNIPHVCRTEPCGYRGDRNGQNEIKERDPHRISKLAYSDDFNSAPRGS